MIKPSAFLRPRHAAPLLLVALAATPLSLVASAKALDASAVRALKELDPSTRLEQRCDIEAMAQIDAKEKGFDPDRVVASASQSSKVEADSVIGDGAAFRSKGKWYALTFTCKTSADHMDIVSFDYTIGAPIPENRWEEFGLWE